jgi:hypothetical protein
MSSTPTVIQFNADPARADCLCRRGGNFDWSESIKPSVLPHHFSPFQYNTAELYGHTNMCVSQKSINLLLVPIHHRGSGRMPEERR